MLWCCRGFSTTRERLRRLALAERAFRGDRGRFGSLSELRLSLAALSLIPAGHPIEILLGNNSWWASECSEAGWIFSIGGEQDSTYYFNGAAMPVSGPPGDGWRSTDDGNWSGDCYW